MYIHKEGYKISISIIIITILALVAMFCFIKEWNVFWWLLIAGLLIFDFVIIRFFRIPARDLASNPNQVIASADGTIVVVEKVFEPEILKTECIQISTFMSPNNVHVNRYPVSGKVVYVNYHSGRYLIAKHPKSSTLNERTTV